MVEHPLDSEKVLVRARMRRHLEALETSVPIERTPRRDYRWRITLYKETWREIALMLTEEIDYGNFKNACRSDAEYERALHEVWDIMWRLQEFGKSRK